MTAYASNQFPMVDDASAIETVRAAVKQEEPFSLVRLGDGEGVVLSIGESIWLQDLAYLHGHWGTERVTLGAAMKVKEDLTTALHSADVVGVRTDVVNVSAPADLLDRSSQDIASFVRSRFHIREEELNNLSTRGARRIALLHRSLSLIDWHPETRFCSAWIHWELLASGALSDLLQEVSHVGLVTSRPELADLISRRFDVRATTVTVPDKYVDAPIPGAHIPDRYGDIRSQLNFPPGTLVLVGAGIPAKAYCHWLKESGCIALDVGSVLDAWVGKASRPRVLESRFGVSGGDHVPQELQLRAPANSSERRLVPRWKPRGIRK